MGSCQSMPSRQYPKVHDEFVSTAEGRAHIRRLFGAGAGLTLGSVNAAEDGFIGGGPAPLTPVVRHSAPPVTVNAPDPDEEAQRQERLRRVRSYVCPIPVRSCVRIQGLVGRSDLNETEAQVLGGDPFHPDRVNVLCIDGTELCLLIRNVEVLQTPVKEVAECPPMDGPPSCCSPRTYALAVALIQSEEFGLQPAAFTGDDGSCSICLQEFNQDETCVGLSCGHTFHVQCVVPWYKKSKTCPNCRC